MDVWSCFGCRIKCEEHVITEEEQEKSIAKLENDRTSSIPPMEFLTYTSIIVFDNRGVMKVPELFVDWFINSVIIRIINPVFLQTKISVRLYWK